MKLTIVLPDGTRQPIEVSPDATLRRLLPALAGKITLPRRDETGTAVAYYATYQDTPLPDDQPLTTLNIPDDAILVLHLVAIPDPHEAIEPEPEAGSAAPPTPRSQPRHRPREQQRPSRWRRFLGVGCGLVIVLSCCLIIGLFSGLAYDIEQARSPILPTPSPTRQVVRYNQEPSISWDFAVIDAQYNASRNQLVMISTNPPQLHIFHPASSSDTLLPLDDVPTAVAVSADGYNAAISHENYVTFIKLPAGYTQLRQEGIRDATDIILKQDDWLYAPAPENQLFSAPIGQQSTTVITLPSTASHHVYQLATDGRSLYGTTRGSNPGRLEKIDISRGEPQFMYDSGDVVNTCGEVWLAENGVFAFTGCGHIWRLADQRQNDMVLLGNFFDTPEKIITLAHSTANERILLITVANDNQILIFDSDGSNLLTAENLPEGAHGRYLFINSQGTQYYVIVQTDNGRFGLITGDI